MNRRWATGANAVLVSLLTLLLAVAVAELAGRHPARLDLSEDGRMTLDPDTVAALALVQQRQAQVTLTAFSAQAKDEAAWARDRMLKDFLAALSAQDQVQTRFVDFDLDRLTAERLGVDRYGTVVVQSSTDRVDLSDRELFRVKGPKDAREVSFIGEAALAGALRQVVSQRRGSVIALSGHGERELYDRGIGELRGLASAVSDQGLTARTVNLLEEGSVPADASVVLMVGPRQPQAPAEVDALRAFLKDGGGIAVFSEGPAPAWLAELGLELSSGVALDPQHQMPSAERPVLGYGSHPVVEGLAKDSVSTVVSVAAPVEIEPMAGVTSSILLRTSRQGWVERGLESPPSYDPQLDLAGPVTVAVALTVARPHPWAGERPGRVVLVGDVDLVTDEIMNEGPGNGTFVTNVIRWLGGTDEPLTAVGRPLPFRKLQLGTTQLGVIRVVLMGGVPALVALAGALLLWSRRQR